MFSTKNNDHSVTRMVLKDTESLEPDTDPQLEITKFCLEIFAGRCELVLPGSAVPGSRVTIISGTERTRKALLRGQL